MKWLVRVMPGLVAVVFATVLLMVPAPAFGATTSWSEWGAWSDWQNDYVAASDTRQVETRKAYNMEVYVCGNSSGTRCYLSYMQGGYTERAHWQEVWGPEYVEQQVQKIGQGSWFSYASNVDGWVTGPGTAYIDEKNHIPFFIKNKDATQYRYRTRAATSGKASKAVTAGDYVIQSKTGSRVLDVNGASAADGANVQIWAKNGSTAQTFAIGTGTVSGSYLIKNKTSGKTLDTAGNFCGSANVQQWTVDNGNKGQSWVFEDAGGGYVYIRNKWGYYLDVNNGTDADGTNVQTWAFNGSDAQKWKLVPLAVAKPVDYVAAFKAGKLTYSSKLTYTGKPLKPSVKLVVGKTVLKEGKHYQLSYKNNTKVGKATLIVKGLGVYKGATLTRTFEIVPKTTKLTGVVAKLTGTSVTVTWNRGAKGRCAGYQIRYSKKQTMAGAKVKTVKGRSKATCAISGLASGTSYYFEIRVYVVIGGTTYRSAWTAPKRVNMPKCGSVSGIVSKASSGTVLKNANIIVYTKGGKRVCGVRSSSSGRYRIPSLAKGTYRLNVSKSGYLVLRITIVVNAGKVTYCENALLVRSGGSYGKASGSVSSATTGRGVSGVKLLFKNGWNNASGATAGSCRTGSGGSYSIRLKCGYYTVIMTCSGYVKATMNIYVGIGTSANQNGVVNPRGNNSKKYRVVLTWGKNPRDIDSHLVSTGSGGDYHIYYRNMKAYSGSNRLAMLDVDDITSYGPETVTFTMKNNSSYNYYVYLFAGTGSLQTSSAQVKLYKGNSLIRTYAVPTRGAGRFWNVFSINNGQVTDKQTITTSPTGVSSARAREGLSSSGNSYRAASL